MKTWIASAGALLLLAACGASKDATAALEAMSLGSGTSSELLKYSGKSGSGDDVTLKGVTLGPAGSQLKAASVKFGGLDLAEGGKPTFKSVTLTDVGPTEKLPDGMTVNLKTITIDGLNPVTGAFIASGFTKTPAEPPPFEQWGFGKISFNGLVVTADGAAIGQPGKLNLSMDELSVSGLKETIFAGAHLAGLKGDFDIPGDMPIKGTFDFGTADVKTIHGKVLGDAVMAGVESAMGAGGSPDAKIMSGLSSPLESGYDEFNWSGMNVDASGAKLVVSKIEQKLTRNAEGVVTAMSMPRATVKFSAEASGGALGQQAGMAMALVGYPSSTVEIYGGGNATFDPPSDTTRYQEYSFGLTDALDVKLNGGFQGLTKAMSALMTAFATMTGGPAADPFAEPAKPGAPAAPAAPEAMPDFSGFADSLKVVDLDVTLTDKSLVAFLVNVGSMFAGAEPEKLRTDIVNQVMALAGDAKGVDKSVAKEFATAVGAFVKQPGTLNIKLKPATPLSLAAAPGKPPASKASLGFSATFTPSPAAPPPAAPAPAKPN